MEKPRIYFRRVRRALLGPPIVYLVDGDISSPRERSARAWQRTYDGLTDWCEEQGILSNAAVAFARHWDEGHVLRETDEIRCALSPPSVSKRPGRWRFMNRAIFYSRRVLHVLFDPTYMCIVHTPERAAQDNLSPELQRLFRLFRAKCVEMRLQPATAVLLMRHWEEGDVFPSLKR